MTSDQPILCTAVVVESGARVLMLRRSGSKPAWPGHWCFPGGRKEGDETLPACAVRELSEETGIAASEADLVEIGATLTMGGGMPWACTVYRMLPVIDYNSLADALRLNAEHDRWGFFVPEYPPGPLHPGAAEVLGWLRGSDPKTVQLLARHSTVTLTLDRYAHVEQGDVREALEGE